MKNIKHDVETWIEERIPELKSDYNLERGVFVEITKYDGEYNLEIEVSHADVGATLSGVASLPAAEKYRDITESHLREAGIKVCFREDWESDLED